MDDSHDAMLDVLLDEQASTRSLVHEAGVAVAISYESPSGLS